MKQYIDAFLYIIITALGFVYLDHIYENSSKLIVLFIMLCGAIFWFNVINIKRLPHIYKTLFQNKLLYIVMSIFLAIDWFCSIYGVAFADPFVYLSVLFISLALSGYINQLKDRVQISSKQLISLILLVLSITVIIVFYHGRVQMLYGILLAILCGITFYGYSLTSIKLLEKGNMSSSEILATRFWIVMLIVCVLMPKAEMTHLSINNILSYLLVGIFTMIIPIYNYQQSLKKIGAIKTSIILCFTPVVTYLMFAIYNNVFNIYNFAISMVIVVAMLFEYITPITRLLKNKRS